MPMSYEKRLEVAKAGYIETQEALERVQNPVIEARLKQDLINYSSEITRLQNSIRAKNYKKARRR